MHFGGIHFEEIHFRKQNFGKIHLRKIHFVEENIEKVEEKLRKLLDPGARQPKTSPQAKRHKPALLITSLTILTSLAFIIRCHQKLFQRCLHHHQKLL